MALPAEDEQYMRRVLVLARRGLGKVSPNPMVGAVLVRAGKVVAEGYHRRFGGDHAEVDAIKHASGPVRAATLYVNLEPCCHWAKTPPCVDAVIQHGIERVVAATIDPNPVVNGKGIEILRQHGVEVDVGVLQQEARKLNEVYFKYVATGLPFVTLKYAQSLDGRIATSRGDAQWISSEKSRQFAHRLRAVHDGIMVGIGTVVADDPQLTVRLAKGKNPFRVILDSKLHIPLDAQVLTKGGKTIIATTEACDKTRIGEIEKKGNEVLLTQRDKDGRIHLRTLLQTLARRGVASILVEGGKEVITSFLRDRLVDRMVIITAPLILGQGIEAIGTLGITSVEQAVRPTSLDVKRLDCDRVFDLRLK